MSNHYFCDKCKGTGESGQYAVLDCTAPGCTAAFDRAEFNAYMAALQPMTQYDRDWAAYQYGRWKQAEASLYAIGEGVTKTNKGN